MEKGRMNAEQQRLAEARTGTAWRKWGPYLSERQWGTVREDYSETGDAWNFFTHDHARSRAYRWGEDGIAGISDAQQHLCFALALWNGQDAIQQARRHLPDVAILDVGMPGLNGVDAAREVLRVDVTSTLREE